MAREFVNKEALYKKHLDQAFLELVEIVHPDLDEPIRIVNNNVAVTHNGNVYNPFPMKFVGISSDEDTIGSATLSMANVNLLVYQELRKVSTPPTFNARMVLSDDLDDVQVQYPGLKAQVASANASIVNITLSYEDYLNTAFPFETYNRATFLLI